MAAEEENSVTTENLACCDASVDIYQHAFVKDVEGTEITCVSFITAGLPGNDLVLTVLGSDAEWGVRVVEAIAAKSVEDDHVIKRCKFVDIAELPAPWTAVAFMEPEHVPGLPMPRNHLQVLLLNATEAAMVALAGSMRVGALLGAAANHYPYPPWNDLARAPVVNGADLEATSARHAAACLHIPGMFLHVDEDGSKALLRLPKATIAEEALKLDGLGDKDAVLFAGGLNLECQRHAVWSSGQVGAKTVEARVPEGEVKGVLKEDNEAAAETAENTKEDGKSPTGLSFVVMSPGAVADTTLVNEDGLRCFLKPGSWFLLKQMLTIGGNLVVKSDSGAGIDLVINFYDGEETAFGEEDT